MPRTHPGLRRIDTGLALLMLMLGAGVMITSDRPASAQGLGAGTGLGSSWRRPADRDAAAPSEMVLQATADTIDRIEAGQENLQDGRISTQPVTEMLVRLRHAVRRYRGSSAVPDAKSVAERSYIEAQLMIVSGGRISAPGTAQCDQFDGEVLICTVDCEGGTFGLRRGRQAGEHFMVVGIADGGAGADRSTARQGFRLATCGARTASSPPLLLPRGGRLSVEIRLFEQR